MRFSDVDVGRDGHVYATLATDGKVLWREGVEEHNHHGKSWKETDFHSTNEPVNQHNKKYRGTRVAFCTNGQAFAQDATGKTIFFRTHVMDNDIFGRNWKEWTPVSKTL